MRQIQKSTIMWDQLIPIDKSNHKNLQMQVRESMVRAILDNLLPLDRPLPSSRLLAKELSVSRNTIVLAFQALVDEGYLISHERRGTFVNKKVFENRLSVHKHPAKHQQLQSSGAADLAPSWQDKLIKKHPSNLRNIRRNTDWMKYRYPFMYGQVDTDQLPLNEWRESVKHSLSALEIRSWSNDQVDQDDPLLIKQIQTRVLSRRGIWAKEDEILITLGTQNALYMVSNLLASEQTVIGMENPGYPDARNIFLLHTRHLKPIEIDDDGMVVSEQLHDCDVVFTTPSHQCPTGAVMPMERRKALLQMAEDKEFVIIEDDYDAEINFTSEPLPALKSLDKRNQVIYLGSMSKSFAPGLRLGYMVGPAAFIREARALRRLMMRHVPANNQRAAALFISLGHNDAQIHKLRGIYEKRWHLINQALQTYFPAERYHYSSGSASFWVRLEQNMNVQDIKTRLEAHEVIIEAGDCFFMGARSSYSAADHRIPSNYFRIGFTSIPDHRIDQGIRMIAEIIFGKIDL